MKSCVYTCVFNVWICLIDFVYFIGHRLNDKLIYKPFPSVLWVLPGSSSSSLLQSSFTINHIFLLTVITNIIVITIVIITIVITITIDNFERLRDEQILTGIKQYLHQMSGGLTQIAESISFVTRGSNLHYVQLRLSPYPLLFFYADKYFMC